MNTKVFKTLIFLLVISSCSKSVEENVFLENMSIIESLKDSISKSVFGNFIIERKHLYKYLNDEESTILKTLGFNNAYKLNDCYVFSFEKINESNVIGEKLDSKITSYSVNLVFSKNQELRNQTSNYEQFLDCRKSIKRINNNWNYILQYKDCN